MKRIAMIALAGLLGCTNGVFAETVAEPVKTDAVKVVWTKKTHEPAIAITIDDCYAGALLRKAVDVAREHDVKLTFFPTGDAVRQRPELWKEIHAAGHEIELHTQSHTRMAKVNEAGQYEAYRKNIDTVRNAVDGAIQFSYARPPCGSGVFGYEKAGCMPSYRRAIGRLSAYNGAPIDIAMWSGDSMFVKRKLTDGVYVQKYFRDMLAPGMIYLYHTRKADIEQLAEMIRYAKENGYRLVTLKELMRLP